MCATIQFEIRRANLLRALLVPACASALIFAGSLSTLAQQPATPTTSVKPSAQQSSANTAKTHRKPAKAHVQPVAAVQAQPLVPPPPPPPAWPANDRPSAATVMWNSQGLRIDASNSSLQQILKDVGTLTGTRIQGLGSDERIFGAYGPGSARVVIGRLLEGSGYNVLMIGDQGQGTPRQVILTSQATGQPPKAPEANGDSQGDDNADAQDQAQPPPQPDPPPPPQRNSFAPGTPPRTPQEILQEMQQRQQQMQRTNPQQ
jgi:hypothetical protein